VGPRRASSDLASAAEQEIRRLIRERGRITFADFMSAALYHPVGGYYTRYGPGRDYRTAPQTSAAFGHLLGWALASMWRALGEPASMPVVEPGAGDGRLASGVTAFLRAREPAAGAATRYLILDRRAAELNGGVLRAIGDAGALPVAPFVGCVVSNELFDALPVHRLVAGGELWVAVQGGRLRFEEGELSNPMLAALAPTPRPAQVLDVSPAADTVYVELCRSVERGFVLTIDYGGERDELYGGHRMAGTLLAYRNHRAVDDLLDQPGEQDLTAHVDFGRLRAAGEAAGLRTIAYTTQRDFLLRLGLRAWLERLDPARLSPADLFNARLGAEELVRTDRLGKLKVLLQARDAGDPFERV
jgi:SAM-dependent MidA family methyltransferase